MTKPVTKPVSVKEQIAVKLQQTGMDFWSCCEHADALIKEFKASGLKRKTYGVIDHRGKCLEVFDIALKD